MTDKSAKKAKACCTSEHERLVNHLDECDRRYHTAEEHHRCYRIAARRSGQRSKKCITAG